MNKQLKKFAEKIIGFEAKSSSLVFSPNELKHFAKLVHQAAMEEAAKICDELNYNNMNSLHCAAAIRNRSEEYLENEQD